MVLLELAVKVLPDETYKVPLIPKFAVVVTTAVVFKVTLRKVNDPELDIVVLPAAKVMVLVAGVNVPVTLKLPAIQAD